MRAKMLSKRGYWKFCKCCNGPRTKKQLRRLEEREWRSDALSEGRMRVF